MSHLEDLNNRKAFLLDKNRKLAVDKRHAKGHRTARENIADICDKDSFTEYGSLVIAGQRTRKPIEDLIRDTPGDGLVCGIAKVNGSLFTNTESTCAVLSYDYTVLAGTQGGMNHLKTDRLLNVAKEMCIPIIFFVEGGGGRPGDTDFYPISIGGLDITTFAVYAGLSGYLPRIAIVNGYCFAGNAALAGSSDIIIATECTSIGMGGPAMIEGGGLGKVASKDVGPISFQEKNGVIDILVKDEAEAVGVAKKYLSYFQGRTNKWETPDQKKLRDIIPKDRKWAYDVQKIIKVLFDVDSTLEIRPKFGRAILTFFGRVEGHPVGIMASNPRHLGGAIDSDAADKASRFMQLCDAFDIPIISLVDCPGFMVGVDCEKTAMVRHASRMYQVAGSVDVPFMSIVLRKAYGLGAMAMTKGGFHETRFTIAWPTGEFGAMGLEGAVKLGFRKELEAITDLEQREAAYQQLLQQAYDQGKALNTASVLEIDEVIDPIESRKWILNILDHYEKPTRSGRKRMVDSW